MRKITKIPPPRENRAGMRYARSTDYAPIHHWISCILFGVKTDDGWIFFLASTDQWVWKWSTIRFMLLFLGTSELRNFSSYFSAMILDNEQRKLLNNKRSFLWAQHHTALLLETVFNWLLTLSHRFWYCVGCIVMISVNAPPTFVYAQKYFCWLACLR